MIDRGLSQGSGLFFTTINQLIWLYKQKCFLGYMISY